MPAPAPSFSVVMPLFNKRSVVRRTMETVLAQTHQAIDVIIIDDGSTDGSAAAIDDLLAGNVRLIRQPNVGPGVARNTGARAATGEWLAFIDADDLWHRTHLANLAGTIAAFPDVDIVASTTRWQPASSIDPELPAIADPRPRKLNFFADTRLGEVHTSSVAIRRTAFLASDGFGSFCPGEDVEFWARLALDHGFARSPLPTSIYVRENGGIMDNDRNQFAGQFVEGPFEQLLARALTDARYADRHRDIIAYADGATFVAARNMLYVGNGRGARTALRRLHEARSPAGIYRAASYVPGPLLRSAARSYGAMKAWLR